MAEYTDSEFEKKLTELRDSQKEIQSLSGWLLDNRKHCKSVLRVWYKCLKTFPPNRKLTCMYLANDVVQNGKRRGPEYLKEFGSFMIKIFMYLSSVDFDPKIIGSLGRLTAIWQERQIFDKKIIHEIQKIWDKKKSGVKAIPASSKHKKEERKASQEERRKSSEVMDIDEMLESPLRKMEKAPPQQQQQSKQPPAAIEERITLSPRLGSPGSGDPPEPEELIVALQDLENSASSDAEVREKIAGLPAEVSEVTRIEDIQSSKDGKRILVQVEEAVSLLTNYNGRLQDELKERRKVGLMVGEFLSAQKDLLAQAEERLELYMEKLERVQGLKDELKSHIAALPDIPMLPGGSGSLSRLPAAGELFRR